ARRPRCSTPRTTRGLAPAPRRGPIGRSPWRHRGPSAGRAEGWCSTMCNTGLGRHRSPMDDGTATTTGGPSMGFNGEAFVQDLREELQASGRPLDQAVWVEKVVQGDATKEDLVGWARQHYWGVTYHTRRFLSEWVTRIPYEMTDGLIENIA